MIIKLFNLEKIYLIIFISLAGWSFFAFFTMTAMIKNQEIYAEIINLSGKQRMLSQKTTLIAKRYFESNDENLKKHFYLLIELMEKDHQYIIQNLKSKETNNIYFNDPTNLNKEVLSYIKLLKEFYKTNEKNILTDIEQISFILLPKLNDVVNLFENESKQETNNLLEREVYILLGTLFTLLIEAIFIVIPSVKIARKKENELNLLNKNLQNKIDEAILENQEKEIKLQKQYRLAYMAEMVTNIAHQWRQPLSVISTIASSLKIEKQFGLLNDDSLISKVDSIMEKTNYLSNTIDSFNEFIKEDTSTDNINIDEEIDKTLSILDSTLKYNSINLIKNYSSEDIFLMGNISKFSQVILNIVSNAKDFLLLSQKKEKWIKIKTHKKDNNVVIIIEDNAGGINSDILKKIFDIYFTTKHQSQGTGLGLYICHEIVTRNFKGSIIASNTEFGARFVISLPLLKSI